MHSISRRTVLHSAACLAGIAGSAAVLPAGAQSSIGPTYMPAQPWTVVVPFAPGGRSSFVAQRLAVALANVLAFVRKHPGRLTIASGADGGTADQAAELFKTMSQTYINRIAGPRLTTDVNAVIKG